MSYRTKKVGSPTDDGTYLHYAQIRNDCDVPVRIELQFSRPSGRKAETWTIRPRSTDASMGNWWYVYAISGARIVPIPGSAATADLNFPGLRRDVVIAGANGALSDWGQVLADAIASQRGWGRIIWPVGWSRVAYDFGTGIKDARDRAAKLQTLLAQSQDGTSTAVLENIRSITTELRGDIGRLRPIQVKLDSVAACSRAATCR